MKIRLFLLSLLCSAQALVAAGTITMSFSFPDAPTQAMQGGVIDFATLYFTASESSTFKGLTLKSYSDNAAGDTNNVLEAVLYDANGDLLGHVFKGADGSYHLPVDMTLPQGEITTIYMAGLVSDDLSADAGSYIGLYLDSIEVDDGNGPATTIVGDYAYGASVADTRASIGVLYIEPGVTASAQVKAGRTRADFYLTVYDEEITTNPRFEVDVRRAKLAQVTGFALLAVDQTGKWMVLGRALRPVFTPNAERAVIDFPKINLLVGTYDIYIQTVVRGTFADVDGGSITYATQPAQWYSTGAESGYQTLPYGPKERIFGATFRTRK